MRSSPVHVFRVVNKGAGAEMWHGGESDAVVNVGAVFPALDISDVFAPTQNKDVLVARSSSTSEPAETKPRIGKS